MQCIQKSFHVMITKLFEPFFVPTLVNYIKVSFGM